MQIATVLGRAVKIASSIPDQGADGWISAICGVVAEAVETDQLALAGELEDGSFIRHAAQRGCAVEIPVHSQQAGRSVPGLSERKLVEHLKTLRFCRKSQHYRK